MRLSQLEALKQFLLKSAQLPMPVTQDWEQSAFHFSLKKNCRFDRILSMQMVEEDNEHE